MRVVLRWFRLFISFCLFGIACYLSLNNKTSVYLLYQAKGQLKVLLNTVPVSEFAENKKLTVIQQNNLALIEEIKKYSVDSIEYNTTDNFKSIYNQGNSPTLWVLTVSEPYNVKPIEWKFPVVGLVSYKGFFNKDLADKEVNQFKSKGFDADLRVAAAWSTLGWFKDPILSSTLNKSKGEICDLFFHELFHATYFISGSLNENENLANFVARKATLKFLGERDTVAKNEYLVKLSDRDAYKNFMLRQTAKLKSYYANAGVDNKLVMKLVQFQAIVDSLKVLPHSDKSKFGARKNRILSSKNAYLIDFEQYDSKQDSLETVFNKFYDGSLKKMVRDLKRRAGNY